MDFIDQLLQDALEKLGEHCDSVLILSTYYEDGITEVKIRRTGNYYASKGLAREWLEDEVQKDAARHIAEKLKDNE